MASAHSASIRFSASVRLSVLVIFLLAAGGCSVTRHQEADEYLLVKNRLKFSGQELPAEELEAYLQQKPNQKLFGLFRPNIELYYMGTKGKDSRFKRWLRNKAGTAPVILDTTLNTISIKQMKMYLANKGYFKSTIRDSVILKRKKAKVEYHISTGLPYRIRNLNYSIADTQLARFVLTDTTRSLIRRGGNYDSYLLDDERTRITNHLMDNGFFRFSTIYVKYRIDTSFRSHQCDITVEIINRVVPAFDQILSVRQVPHKRYLVNRIYIYPEFDHLVNFTGRYDTLIRTYDSPFRGQPGNTYHFLSEGKFRVQPRTIAQSVFITPGSYYNLKDVNQTYSRLSSLQIFRYINIQFRETDEASHDTAEDRDKVDCHIELSRAPAQSISPSIDGTNSSGAFGVQGSLGYQNRNIFSGAQLFRLNLSGSLQMQAQDGVSGNKFFNVIELGVNGGITFPQFLLPVRPERLSKYFKPRTVINVGYNYQHQQHYDRHISNITFGYTWDQNDRIRHILNPMEVSLVKVFTDAFFDSVMNNEQDNRLKNQYTDHMVAGLKYNFSFSNQQVGKTKDFVYLRANLETGGNLLFGISSLFRARQTGAGIYQVFGLPYAQYVRPDIDLRYYSIFPGNFSVVYRFYGGIGVPYGNVSVLPFEKAFFAGGANGMRGWKMYTLGPGTFRGDDGKTTFSQIGDMQLEANVEYRFPLYSWIRGALFVDAGNIWLTEETRDLPGGKFRFRDFLGQIALDAGVGIRLDFDFFIFRLDPAIRLYVPSYPKDHRWYFNKMQLNDIVWNFGIGYPF